LSGATQVSQWYAAYTKHNHERKVAAFLSQKEVEVFLPLYLSVRQWKDRKKRLSLPIFPGYVFFRLPLDKRATVLGTPGVFFIVESGGKASPIPVQDIQSMQIMMNSQAAIAPHPFLHTGDRVRITRGPLEGVVGILQRMKSQYRLVLCVEALRQAIAVEIDSADVEKSSDPLAKAASGPYS